MKFSIFFLFFVANCFALENISTLDYIRDGLNQNADIARIKSELSYYDTLKLSAYSRFLPKLTLSGSKVKDTLDSETTEYSRLSLNAQLNLFNFGSDLYYLDSISDLIRSKNSELTTKEIEIERDITNVVFDLIYREANIEIYRKLVEVKKRAFDIAKKRYELGRLSREELFKIEIDYENNLASLNDEVTTLNNTKVSFNTYSNLDLIKRDWFLRQDQATKLLGNLRQKDDIWRTHPQVNSKKFLRDYNLAQKKSSFLDMFGGLDLTISKGKNVYDEGNVQDDRISLMLTIPLFNGFNDYADYKQKNVAYQYSDYNLREVQRNLRSAYENQKENLKLSIVTMEKRERTYQISKKLFQNTLQQFEKGSISVNDLILDQDRVLRTELLYNAGKKQLHQSVVASCHILGRTLSGNCFNL